MFGGTACVSVGVSMYKQMYNHTFLIDIYIS